MASAELILDAKDIVGESIIWSGAEAALYWVDIVGGRIHRLDPASGDHQIWPTLELPTSIGLRPGGGFFVGLRQRVTLWQPGGSFETLAVPEPDRPRNRLNEGVVAPDGAFWVGTMEDNISPDGSPQAMTASTGALYRIAPDGAVKALTPADIGITNTMIWTDDGRFITADTLANQLYQYDYDAASGTISNRRPFGPPIARGLPDGSTRDAAGTIYNARVAGGSAIARLTPQGELAGFIALPCASPTSCAFGGPGLDTLFVTSARFGMTAEELERSPHEGGLFAVRDLG
jgi:sugar lactone lactonase YvrE